MTNRTLRFLAIRHKPSGGLLPSVRGYGFTRVEPTKEEPPRLFVRPSSATQALDYWLAGEHEQVSDDLEDSVRLHVTPRPDRQASQMEIVEIELVVRSLDEAKLRLL